MGMQLDFEQENLMFERAAAAMSMRLDKLPGGFYAASTLGLSGFIALR
ncbi:hypothetical protein [Pseudomonas amygdali]